MPLEQYIIASSFQYSSNETNIKLLSESNSNEVIEDVTFISLVGGIRQLISLVENSGTMFAELIELTSETSKRIDSVKKRTQFLLTGIYENSELPLNELNVKKPSIDNFRNNTFIRSTRTSLPKCLNERYNSTAVKKMPSINLLDPYRKHIFSTLDEIHIMSFAKNYSNPEYFLKQWYEDQEKRIKTLEKDFSQYQLDRKLSRLSSNNNMGYSLPSKPSKKSISSYIMNGRRFQNGRWKKYSGWVSVVRGSLSRRNLLNSEDFNDYADVFGNSGNKRMTQKRSSMLLLDKSASQYRLSDAALPFIDPKQHQQQQKQQQQQHQQISENEGEQTFTSTADSDDEVEVLDSALFAQPKPFIFDKSININSSFLSPSQLISLEEINVALASIAKGNIDNNINESMESFATIKTPVRTSASALPCPPIVNFETPKSTVDPLKELKSYSTELEDLSKFYDNGHSSDISFPEHPIRRPMPIFPSQYMGEQLSSTPNRLLPHRSKSSSSANSPMSSSSCSLTPISIPSAPISTHNLHTLMTSSTITAHLGAGPLGPSVGKQVMFNLNSHNSKTLEVASYDFVLPSVHSIMERKQLLEMDVSDSDSDSPFAEWD